MLILVFTRMSWKDGSVTISLRNFVGEGIIRNFMGSPSVFTLVDLYVSFPKVYSKSYKNLQIKMVG